MNPNSTTAPSDVRKMVNEVHYSYSCECASGGHL